ncbi:general transcription and DNA repair factor IIH subunit TFB1-1-like [Rhododendron vialii]|uniref:general transcription and DNA repair factor IIH subunit TFB1-1-like n=1 Tax=Rhododendron vialii TaxID=182163 RepID=UPI00265F1E72|nr:general transcription and DNA repair factor IIH subunit TFB1-1-like [Rhododendron vialii]
MEPATVIGATIPGTPPDGSEVILNVSSFLVGLNHRGLAVEDTLFDEIRRVDTTLDMEADDGDDYIHLPVLWDHGMSRVGSDSATDSQYEEYTRSFSQVFNCHGAVVLEGRSIDVELGDTRSVPEALARSK